MNDPLVLLTGATGYVGGRLLKKLESLGVATRCLARHPEHLRGRIGPGVEVVAGDVMDSDSLAAACCRASTRRTTSFIRWDRPVPLKIRIDWAPRTSVRLLARREFSELSTWAVWATSNSRCHRTCAAGTRWATFCEPAAFPVIEFRASIILGSGSLSFELIRSLVERLPVMITPRWVRVPAQPIAINDVLSYLIAALDLPHSGSRTYEIGGADQVSYADLMKEYARQRGLKRWLIPVPVLTPRSVELVAGVGHACLRSHWPQTDREHSSSDRRPRPGCPGRVPDPPSWRSASDCRRPPQRGPGTGSNSLVGCLVFLGTGAELVRRPVWSPAG